MVADLDIDLDDLEALVGVLAVVRREFDGAEQFATTVADLVGHDGLAGVVRDFATQWNLRRSELLEELDYLAEATTSIRDTMIELDLELGEVMENYRPDLHAGGGGGGGGGGGR